MDGWDEWDSETRRLGRDRINSRGFTYYWSSISNGADLRGIAIGISIRLQPSFVEVTLVDEHIMQLRLKHILDFVSCYSALSDCVWGLHQGDFLCQTWLHTGPVPPLGNTHCLGRLQYCHWHWKSWLRVMCWSSCLWYQEQTALSFWILQNLENREFQAIGIRDQICTAGLGIAMSEW